MNILNGTPYAPPSHKAQDEASCLFLGVCYKGSIPAPIAIMGRIPRHVEGNYTRPRKDNAAIVLLQKKKICNSLPKFSTCSLYLD